MALWRELVKRSTVLLASLGLILFCGTALAQTGFRNLSNTRFRTIGDGPQSAHTVDLPSGSSQEQFRELVKSRAATLSSGNGSLAREMEFLRRHRMIKSTDRLGYHTRHNEYLPSSKHKSNPQYSYR